jgi:serine/threonine protein kinase
MTDSEIPVLNGQGPMDLPKWGESLSREIEDLARGAQGLRAAWNQRFGSEAFLNPLFVKSYVAQIRGHSILGVFKAVHGQDPARGAESGASFEDRFLRTAEGLAAGAPAEDPVEISPLHYLGRIVEQAESQKAEGFLVDPEPIGRLLTFVSQLKDLPALSGFRVDQFDRFPSKITEADPEASASDEEPAPRELPEGTRLGKVQVVRRIAVGGFAQVYLVFHPGLKEHRAAKLFTKRDLLGELPNLLKAFYGEAQLQNQLKHPNIVRVLDVDEHEGYLVLHMEYVEGRHLRSLIEERKKAKTHLAPLEILRLAREVAKGLGYAHAQGIMHRDMKPENILIAQDGSVKITDFGLAKTLNDSGQRRTTRLGNLLGTPQYMAPEQVFGDSYDLRVDLYALGAVIYHMAWGQPPFIGRDAWKLLERQRDEKPVPLTTLIKGFPPELDRIVTKLLEKNPDHRYLSATELTEDLESCQAALSNPGLRAPKRRRRAVGIAAGLFVLLVLAAIPGVGALRRWIRAAGDAEVGSVHRDAPASIVALHPAKDPDSPPKAATLPTLKASSAREAKEVPPASKKVPPPPEPDRRPDPGPTEPAPKKTEPAPPRLREKLAAQPVGQRTGTLMGEVLGLVEQREPELRSASYEGLARDLDRFEKDRLAAGDSEAHSSDERLAASHVKALRRMLDLAREVVRERLERLKSVTGPVVLRIAGGGLVSGKVQALGDGKISLRDEHGGTVTVEVSKLAPEEFVPDRGAPAAQLAFQGLTLHPARTLGLALDLEAEDESLLLWAPFLVRLARLEVRRDAGDTALEARDLLAKSQAAPDATTGVLLHHVAFAAAERDLSKESERVLPLFGYLEPDFSSAQRERESLDLLLARRYSRVLASYTGTASASVAGALLLGAFLADLDAGSEELLNGSGWFNNRWEIWPKEPDLKARQQLFNTQDPKLLVFRDRTGTRSLIMNDNSTRAPEGLLLRLRFLPEPGQAERACWSLLLRGGKDGRDSLSLRVDASGIGLYRQVLEPGAKDACLVHAPLPPVARDDRFRTVALVPAEDHLHVFVDGDIVLSLPRESGEIPHQLDFSVSRGSSSVQSLLARKPVPTPEEGAGKKNDTDRR